MRSPSYSRRPLLTEVEPSNFCSMATRILKYECMVWHSHGRRWSLSRLLNTTAVPSAQPVGHEQAQQPRQVAGGDGTQLLPGGQAVEKVRVGLHWALGG